MKLPQQPPAWEKGMSHLPKQRMAEVILHSAEVAKRDRYLHWDEVRRRPPPHGFSHEEWWLALRLGRMAKLRPVTLRDKNQTSFCFGTPDALLEQLHEIDRGLGFAVDLPDAVTRPETRDHYVVSSLIQESITASERPLNAIHRELPTTVDPWMYMRSSTISLG